MQEWIQRGIFSPVLSLPWKVEESDRKQCPCPEPGRAEYKPVCQSHTKSFLVFLPVSYHHCLATAT